MENEWRRLQRALAYHPHVTLTPLGGDPPAAYQVDFRLTTVIVNPRTSQLEYVANASVQILLGPAFPNEAPTVRPLNPIFHPNVSYEGLSLEGLWHPNETLLGLVRKVGDVLAYRSYDPDYAVNDVAMQWLIDNHTILPIDQQANLSPQAGGEPLDRICKYGPQSLESMKQSIVATQSAMFGASAPDPATLRSYAAKTRMALNLFTENDVPEHLRSVASELDAAARELVAMAPLYDFVRERRRRIAALRQAIKLLAASKSPLVADLDKLVALADASTPADPMAALKRIPATAVLQPLQISLPRLVDDAEKRFAVVKSGLVSVNEHPQPALVPTDSLLGGKLDRELSLVDSNLQAVRAEAEQTLADVEPVLNRAGSEATALDFAVRWREYLDMADKARLIERNLREWGSEGLQAYYIENAGGRYGPFQLEQSVDLGAGPMFIRNNSGRLIELWDHHRDKPLATNATGVLSVALPAPGEETAVDAAGNTVRQTIPTRFSLTERCDDLAVLLDFLRRSAIETVQKFAAYNGDADSWAGKVCRILSEPEVKKALEEELARAARRWRHIIVDLASLGPWKERLATHYLLQRAAEAAPQLLATIDDARQKAEASKKKVNDIMSRSSRDVETGSMIVPPKYSKQYQEELKLQQACANRLKVATLKRKSLVAQLTDRLQHPKRLGKGVPPTLRVLPALPPALVSLPLADGRIGHPIVALEHSLQVELGGPRPEEYPPEPSLEQHEPAEEGLAYASADAAPADDAEYVSGDTEAYASADESDAPIAEPAAVEESAEWERKGNAPAGDSDALPVEAVSDDAANAAAIEAEQAHSTDNWIVQDEDDLTTVDPGQADIVFGFDPEPDPTDPTRPEDR